MPEGLSEGVHATAVVHEDASPSDRPTVSELHPARMKHVCFKLLQVRTHSPRCQPCSTGTGALRARTQLSACKHPTHHGQAGQQLRPWPGGAYARADLVSCARAARARRGDRTRHCFPVHGRGGCCGLMGSWSSTRPLSIDSVSLPDGKAAREASLERRFAISARDVGTSGMCPLASRCTIALCERARRAGSRPRDGCDWVAGCGHGARAE